MDMMALRLSRIQFAFTIIFHIIFPSFTIGLAAWFTVFEALGLATGRPVYRGMFEFWLKIFGVAFGLGVVSGIVMGFQFGTNWSVLSKMSGPILQFMFWGGTVVFPLMLLYTVISYSIFTGKVAPTAGHH
jgi:cytochrome bd ubiquinol oxidase subunit I